MGKGIVLWTVHPRGAPPFAVGLPGAIVTRDAPRFPGLAPEVSLLLPAGDPLPISGPLPPAPEPGVALGLFLADPFLDPDRTAARIRDAGYAWLANFPAVAQHDAQFLALLGDVGLAAERERRAFEAARAVGLRVLEVVCRDRPALDGPDAILAVAPVGHTAPAARSLRAAGIDRPILSLADDADADARVLAPSR